MLYSPSKLPISYKSSVCAYRALSDQIGDSNVNQMVTVPYVFVQEPASIIAECTN